MIYKKVRRRYIASPLRIYILIFLPQSILPSRIVSFPLSF